MKLSIALFAAASAVDSDFERPAICSDLPDAYTNCWKPYGHFATQNGTAGFVQTNTGGECGFQYQSGESLVNQTCSVNLVPGAHFEAGNAAFVAKEGTENGKIVGFDLSGDVNIIQSWDITFDFEQDFNDKLDAYVAAVDDANKYNTTLPEEFSYDRTGDCSAINSFSLSCSDSNADGSAYDGLAIMITNQHENDPNNNYAIANYPGKDQTFTVTLNTGCPNGVTAHDENAFTVNMRDYSTCQFTVDVKNGRAELFYFQGETNPLVDFFSVEIQK